MAVALILITHDGSGQQLLATAEMTLAQKLQAVKALVVPPDCKPERSLEQGRNLCEAMDQGDGVLILTDLYGSTPGNISRRLCGQNVHAAFGLNLAMLIKVLNYRHLPLDELSKKAIEGGVAGIRICLSDHD